jgi:transposase InsO family protein
LSLVPNNCVSGKRPYLKIKIYDLEFRGLLDSGSEISIIGGNSIKYFSNLATIHMSQDFDNIQTANGSSSPVVGYIFAPVTVQGKTIIIKFYLVPGVSTELILGMNFWKKFNIAPDVLALLNRSEYFSNKDHVSAITCTDRFLHDFESLSDQERKLAEEVILQFQDISYEKRGLGRTNVVTHKIDTGDHLPIKQRYYVMSPERLVEVHKHLDQMIKDDVVEPSNSAWNNPITMARKADGTLRFCLDSRKLNEVSKHDAYPMPYISNILDQLKNAKYLSSIDLKNSFFQVPLDSVESREKTAFTVPSRGLFHFKVMCFGLTSASATQQRLMDRLFGPEFNNVFIYCDDVIIFSDTLQHHLELLRKVKDKLKEANLTINFAKCQFFRKQLKYLGHVIDEFGLRTDPDKVKAIIDFPTPTNRKEVKRFLGTASYYRRFIKNFSHRAGPLNALTSTRKTAPPFHWSAEANNAFNDLKTALTCAPVLACPDFSREFAVHCDASDFGIGGTLTQTIDGHEHPIAYCSRSLSPAERNYSATEREALAVVHIVEHFRPYLEGSKQFRIITDHASLKWFLNLKNPTGRLARWGCRLSPYNFVIEHRAGTQNIVPDALSRSVPVALIEATVTNDAWYNNIVKRCTAKPRACPNFQVVDGKLFRFTKISNRLSGDFQWKQVVPLELRDSIIKENHSEPTAAHLGVAKTYKRLRLRYFWPGMYKDTANFIKQCATCSAYKHSTLATPGFMGEPKVCCRPFQCLSIDLVGPLPMSRQQNTYLLVVVCCFTKYCLLFPLRRATGKVISQRLEDHVFLVHGIPQTIISDNGSQFISHEVQSLYEKYNIPQVHLGPVYCPQVNTVERYNRTIITAVASFVENDHRAWDANIHKIQFAINTSVNESTSYTPFMLVHGREAIVNGSIYAGFQDIQELVVVPRDLHADNLGHLSEIFKSVQISLRKAHDKNIKYYNNKRRDISFEVGDVVWKRTYKQSAAHKYFSVKLAPKYERCKVIRKLSPLVYELEDENGKFLGKWHIKDFKDIDKSND